MESEQPDAVYTGRSLDFDDDVGGGGGESDSDTDPPEKDDVLPVNDGDEDVPLPEDLSFSSTSSLTVSLTPTTKSMESKTPVTIAVASESAATVGAIHVDFDPKWQCITEIVRQKPQIDDSRRLFQRLWTDEDEIELLRGFHQYTAARRGSSSHPPDTAPFFELIKSKLQLDFNKSQLAEKLRRLKKKYRNVMSKINSGKEISFKTAHDHAAFEISRNIWSHAGKILGFEDSIIDIEETSNTPVNNTHNNLNLSSNFNPNCGAEAENGVEKKVNNNNTGSRKRPRSKLARIEEENSVPSDGFAANTNSNTNNTNNNLGYGANITSLVEETVRSNLSPVITETLNGTASMMMNAMAGGMWYVGAPWSPMVLPPSLGFGSCGGDGVGGEKVVDERRRQRITELEVYLRRLELVKNQIKLSLHELSSIPGR